MRTLLGSLALAVTTGLVGTALPADAGSLTVTDQTGDVSQGRVDLDGGYVYQSNIREGDFIATTFRHGPRAVVVTSRFRDLGRVGTDHIRFLTMPSHEDPDDYGRVKPTQPAADRLFDLLMHDRVVPGRLATGSISAGAVPGSGRTDRGPGAATTAELEYAGLCA